MMKQRCYNPTGKSYANYGGRGIKMSPEWSRFKAFETALIKAIGPRPSDGHTVDRIDNDGHYCSENVRWATSHEQHRNRRDNRFVEAFGRRLLVLDWAELTGIPRVNIIRRLDRGWEPHLAVSRGCSISIKSEATAT